MQAIDVARLDPYLASVSDQEQALRDSDAFGGRLVLRSQRAVERFWLLDAWTDRRSMETATIALRTLSSVAGLIDEPREIETQQVRVGSAELVAAGAAERDPDDPLPFFLVGENHVKPVVLDEYLETQERMTRELEEEEGYTRRLLLRDLRERAHFIVVDEWASERAAFEAFERRQGTVSQTAMTRFLALLAERKAPDFALGLHA